MNTKKAATEGVWLLDFQPGLVEERSLHDKVPQGCTGWFSCCAPRTNTAKPRTGHSAGLQGEKAAQGIADLRPASCSCSAHHLPALGTSFADWRCCLLAAPAFTLKDKKLSVPISYLQKPCARLLLPSLFQLKNLPQRTSLGRNSQVLACIWIPSQTLGGTLCYPPAQCRACWPHQQAVAKEAALDTEQQNRAGFECCQRTVTPWASPSSSSCLRDLHPSRALASASTQAALTRCGDLTLQQPTPASPTGSAECRDLQGPLWPCGTWAWMLAFSDHRLGLLSTQRGVEGE